MSGNPVITVGSNVKNRKNSFFLVPSVLLKLKLYGFRLKSYKLRVTTELIQYPSGGIDALSRPREVFRVEVQIGSAAGACYTTPKADLYK